MWLVPSHHTVQITFLVAQGQAFGGTFLQKFYQDECRCLLFCAPLSLHPALAPPR